MRIKKTKEKKTKENPKKEKKAKGLNAGKAEKEAGKEAPKEEKKEPKEALIGGRLFAGGLFLFLFSCLLSMGMERFYKHPEAEALRNTVMVALGAGCVVYAMFQARVEKSYDFNNQEHPGRFVGIYLVCMVFASIMPLLPSSAWPFLPAAVALALFSNGIIGVTAYSVLVMYAVFLTEGTMDVFFLYFLSGFAAILLFRRLDEVFKVGVPFALSLLLLLVMETAAIVLFINESLSWEMFIMPFMNLFLTGILLLCVLKYFSFAIVHQYRERYLEVNDPEFSLLVDMKAEFRDSYFLAVHTAYFCERIATCLGLNSMLIKAGGYYHRIGRLKAKQAEASGESGADEMEMLEGICEEYEFPPQVLALLKECAVRDYRSKESIIVMFSDAVISSLLYLFQKEPEKEPDYEAVVEMIFRKKQENGILDNGEITLREMKQMKQIFREEKLYYDFLR